MEIQQHDVARGKKFYTFLIQCTSTPRKSSWEIQLIKVVLLPMNSNSFLQLLEASIIQCQGKILKASSRACPNLK